MITAMGAIIGGTMSVLSKEYFGLLGTELWVGALGIPVGSITSASAALLIGRMSDLKRFVFSAFLPRWHLRTRAWVLSGCHSFL